MTVEEAKAKIFHWLCSRYHDPGKGNEYIEKDTLKFAIGIPEDVFEKALNEFVDPGAHDCVEVEIPTGRLRLGTGGLRFCEAGTIPCGLGLRGNVPSSSSAVTSWINRPRTSDCASRESVYIE